MAVPQFDIVFRGVHEGFEPTQVKQQFASLFKLDESNVERIFNGATITLKKQLDEKRAEFFAKKLAAIGVLADRLQVANSDTRDSHSADKAPLVDELQRTPANSPIIEMRVTSATPVPASKAIYFDESDDACADACAMHQPVEAIYPQGCTRMPFEFSGRGREYFAIWCVNLIVILFSAGLLYPWAHIRTLRYFHQHLTLQGLEFEYKSHPAPLFLMQFIVWLSVGGIVGLAYVSPVSAIIAVLVWIALLPAYWHRCAPFVWQHSRYCDRPFHYTSNLRDTYTVFLFWPLVSVLSLGILAPVAAYKMQKHSVQSQSLDTCSFQFNASMKSYWLLLPSLLIAEALTFSAVYFHQQLPLWPSLVVVVGTWLFVVMNWRSLLIQLRWNSTSSKWGHFDIRFEPYKYARLMGWNLVLCVVTLGLYWPWAKVKSATFLSNKLVFLANTRFKKWVRRCSAV